MAATSRKVQARRRTMPNTKPNPPPSAGSACAPNLLLVWVIRETQNSKKLELTCDPDGHDCAVPGPRNIKGTSGPIVTPCAIAIAIFVFIGL